MTKVTSIKSREPSLARDWLRFFGYHPGGRRTLLVPAVAAIAGGTALNWEWLVATGLASILLTLLPCAAMCGVGLCAHRLFGRYEGSGRVRRDPISAREDDQRDHHSAIPGQVQNCCGGDGGDAGSTAPQEASVKRRDADD